MRSLLVLAAASAAALPAGLLSAGLLPAGPAQKASEALEASAGPPPPPGVVTEPAIVRHRPPVDAPVVDVFRPPASPFGPGNRGIDYATAEGTPVRASADGQVAFAGPVGGRLHVVIRHGDGIRTSYSFLAAIDVRRGQRVSAGAEVGTAGPSLHFGARRGDAYIDPLTLFGLGGEGRVHLVPDEPGQRANRTPSPSPPSSPVAPAIVRWARSASR
ncbi:MAG TPA: M23 family metallopeptidase [Acidimicrobiales bacterium]|nr:M23 family metallopeptidase [Acidimicrobiales bacterium]